MSDEVTSPVEQTVEPVPDLAAMRLPLDRDRLRTALRDRNILLGPSLWALLGEPSPSWLGLGGYDRAPGYLPGGAPGGGLPAGRRDWRADAARLLAARAAVAAGQAVQAGEAGEAEEMPPVVVRRAAPRRPAVPRPVPAGQLPLF